jgi:hypothetical protein
MTRRAADKHKQKISAYTPPMEVARVAKAARSKDRDPIKTDGQGHVVLSDDDIARIAAAVDDRANCELIKALTAVISKAGCPGSSVDRYGLVPAVEAIVDALHRVQEQCSQFQGGTAYRKLNDEHMALRSRSWALCAALEQALNVLEDRSSFRAQIEEWRKLVKDPS